TPGPARVRVGLVPADVTDGLVGRQRFPLPEPAAFPAAPPPAPVERVLQGLRSTELPPRRLPELLSPVASILDEGEILAVRDREAVDEKRRHVHHVPGPLVVVGPGTVASHLERTAGNEHLAGLGSPRPRGGNPRWHRLERRGGDELERGEEGLGVL